MVRNSTLVQVKLNGTEYFRKSISAAKQLDAQVGFVLSSVCALRSRSRSVCPPAPGPFDLRVVPRQVLYLGGPPPLPPPGNATVSPATPTLTSTPAPAPAHSDPDDADYFKGVIQDVQVLYMKVHRRWHRDRDAWLISTGMLRRCRTA